jgi:3-dehydroquinate dehydratase/shikimate dehydrogenase
MEPIVSLTPEVAADPIDALASPPEGAAVVEIRADLFDGLDLAAAVSACPLPTLVTVRSTVEGGKGPDDPSLRAAVFEAARDAGAALIDIELNRDLETVESLGLTPEQTVVSWHDPEGTPEDLDTVTSSLLAQPSRLVKAVPTAHTMDDVGSLLQAIKSAGRAAHRLIAFSMGTVGMVTRFLGPLRGSPVTYAAWVPGAAAAAGQMDVARMLAVAGHLKAPPQRLFGVIGRDVSASLSPEMHAAAYRALDLPYLFVPISVPDTGQLPSVFTPAGTTVFDEAGFPASGWAVTTPYKRDAWVAATMIAPRVERAMAANTVILRPDGLMVDNTDADGIVGSLVSADIDPIGKPAVVQGTGGAARGAAVGLDLAGASTWLRGRNPSHTEDVAASLGVQWLEPDQPTPDGAILVNATPLGSLGTDPSPFGDHEVENAAVVVDMVYCQDASTLQGMSARFGTPYIGGRSVLAHQGFAQFAAFTGQLPPKAAMLAALERPDS